METDRNWNERGSALNLQPSGAEGLGAKAKNQAKNTAAQAREQMRSMADAGREEVAGQISGIARALKSTSDQLRAQNQEQAGHYTEIIGDQAQRISRYLEEKDASALVSDIEGFARRQPLLFLGGCVAVGFAVGRFFKASAPTHDETHLGSSYGSSFPTMSTGYPEPELARPPVVRTEVHAVGSPTGNTGLRGGGLGGVGNGGLGGTGPSSGFGSTPRRGGGFDPQEG